MLSFRKLAPGKGWPEDIDWSQFFETAKWQHDSELNWFFTQPLPVSQNRRTDFNVLLVKPTADAVKSMAIGIIHSVADWGKVVIEYLDVSRLHRAAGMGSMFLQNFISQLPKSVRDVRLFGVEDAVPFYLRLGFKYQNNYESGPEGHGHDDPDMYSKMTVQEWRRMPQFYQQTNYMHLDPLHDIVQRVKRKRVQIQNSAVARSIGSLEGFVKKLRIGDRPANILSQGSMWKSAVKRPPRITTGIKKVLNPIGLLVKDPESGIILQDYTEPHTHLVDGLVDLSHTYRYHARKEGGGTELLQRHFYD
jgi:hypothetical protein